MNESRPHRQRAEEFFQRVVSLTAEEQRAYLDAHCRDPAVRAEVEKFLDYEREHPGSRTADVVLPARGAAGRESAPGRGDLPLASPLRPTLSSGFDHGRFLPGTVIGKRYRIVALLGRGGMGEVYRADDLELGQSVALKFLPERLGRDEAALDRFRGEVRLARQVSHPNVCRVYDMGQVDGDYFLSMEYVDGEDLGLLLKRIGRFPSDRAIGVARQLCLGLAAAHEKGVLHRDLKPANVMVDGRGKLLITDFGLAELSGGVAARDIRSGTPAYMAPEQLAGREVTERSDIYSLGLVLHEVFTGKPVWEANTLAELFEKRRHTPTPSPSSHVESLDPAVERVIQRCLQADPARRPSSAIAVAAALPGGDPLQAALAAGETPSPAMVAEAGAIEGMRPLAAFACLVGFVAILIGTSAIRPRTLAERVGLDDSPEVLRVRATDIVRELGYTDLPEHVASGLTVNRSYLRLVAEQDGTAARWQALAEERPSAILFWHRWNPSALKPTEIHTSFVDADDPPQFLPGSLSVRLDKNGRLWRLTAVPPESKAEAQEEHTPERTPDWSEAFRLAGLELKDFRPTQRLTAPPASCDVAMAWEGEYPNSTYRVVVEAGGRRGRLTHFRIVEDLARPEETARNVEETQGSAGMMIFAGLIFISAVIARRNLLRGRGDRKGAFRMAVFIFLVYWVGDAFMHADVGASWVLSVVFDQPLAHALMHASVTWLIYMALEPFVRRLWPTVMVSWARLLEGRYRDPRVGRDILIGGLMGAIMVSLTPLAALLQEAFGVPTAMPLGARDADVWALDGVRWAVMGVFMTAGGAIFSAVSMVLVLLVLKTLVRKTWIASLGAIALFGLPLTAPEYPLARWTVVVVGILVAILLLFVLLRLGFVATVMAFFVRNLSEHIPLSLDFAAWSAQNGFLIFIVLVSLMVYGFRCSLGGRPLIRDFIGGL